MWAIHLPVSPPTNVISLAFQEVSHDLLKPSRGVMRSFRPMQPQSKSEHAGAAGALKKNIRKICEPCGFRINGAYGFFDLHRLLENQPVQSWNICAFCTAQTGSDALSLGRQSALETVSTSL